MIMNNNKPIYQPIFVVLMICSFYMAILLLSDGSQYIQKSYAELSSTTTNATTTSIRNLTSSSETITPPIYQQHSQAGYSKVIDVTNASAKLEAPYSGNGFVKDISVKDVGTILYTLQSNGAVNGTGQGYIISAADGGEMVTYTFKGGGQVGKEGNIPIQGTWHFNNSIPTGNLAFLSNVKGMFKGEVSSTGVITLQVWQQK